MTESEVLKLFKSEKALLEGHFLLSSGLHSASYMQCALLLQKPRVAEELCKTLAVKIKDKPSVVIGPALGGIVVAYELGRALKVRGIFSERVDGSLALRRGFSIERGEKVLVAEDVVTTGKSTNEVIGLVKQSGAVPCGVAAIVDRSGGANPFSTPFYSLLKINIDSHKPEACPLCKEGKLPAVKPGSRGLK